MKKTLSLILLAVLILSFALTGCTAPSGGGEATAAPGSAGEPSANFSYPMDPITLTINMDPQDYSTIPDWALEYYWYDVLAEKTGVTLDCIGSAAGAIDMTDEFLLLLASGDYPDMLRACWASGFPGGPNVAIQDGYIITLDEYSEYFPRLSKYLEENPKLDAYIRNDEGQLYCFPKITLEEVGTGPVVRQDWLDQLNLDVPETVDEWHNTLTLFKEELGVPSPLTFEFRWMFLEYAASSLSSPYGVTYPFYIMDGEVKFGPLEEGYPEFLAMMADWYSQKLIDPDIASVDKNTVQAKFATGEAGIAIQQIGNVSNCIDANLDDPDYAVTPLKAMVESKGDEPQFSRWVRPYDGGHSIAISTGCDNIEAVCRYLDYLYGDEGAVFANFGDEGIAHEIVDGEYVWSDFILNNPNGGAPGSVKGYIVPASNWHKVNVPAPTLLTDKVQAIYEGWVCNMSGYVYPTVTHTLEETEAISGAYNDIDTYCREWITKFVLGTTPMSEYENFKNELIRMGIEDVLAVKAAAYERFVNR
ncbi:MAG: extracellular solute-binding protein [Christensenellales bacterium]|jgi:putative aldouronate transport system substrate-binding protein